VQRDVGALAQRQAAFERRDGRLDVSLAEAKYTHKPQYQSSTVGVFGLFGQPYRIFSHAAPCSDLPQLGNGLHQGQGHLGTNDCGGLEHVFLLRRQPVDARCQHRLHGGWHLQAGEGFRETIGPRRTAEHPRLHQGTHALLQKERIALGAGDQEGGEGRQTGVISQQHLEEFVRTRGR
jgi:hypothetical protein